MNAFSNSAIGDLPIPTREYYNFDGWFTERVGGTRITSETVISRTDELTLYAHWSPISFLIAFNPNSGSLSTTEITGYCNQVLGDLPTPTRTDYSFDGWFTEESGGTQITSETVLNRTEDLQLYAHWTQKPVSDWVEVNQIPADAEIVNSKWSYTEREYTTNAASSLSGWTKYDTQRTSWGATQGPVYSDPSNGVRNVWSEEYEVSRTHYYHYFRYRNSSGSAGSDLSWGDYTTYESIDLTYPLTEPGANGNNAQGYRWYYQDPVYTYYYYRDVNKEATTDPTGTANVSNIKKWVQYREK